VDQLHLLRQAVALGQHRNFARAAESMNTTQPSLTRGIAALERSLGVLLFERTRKGVVPTAYGRVLIERAGTLLRSHTDLRRELQLLAGLKEAELSIGAGPYAAETSVAQTLARPVSAHPRLRIQCLVADPDQVVQDVLAGRVDIGIARIEGLDQEQALVIEALPPLRIHLACRPGHPLTREARPSLARVLEFPLATTLLRGAHAWLAAAPDRDRTQEAPAAAEFAPQITVNSLAVARIIAAGSDAIVPGTAAHLADDVAAGRLVRLPVEPPSIQSPHGIFFRRDRPLAPAATAFIETLRLVEEEARQADAVSRPPAAAAAGARRRVGSLA
jgi:DNA-binding transcriptional LysR family regulator